MKGKSKVEAAFHEVFTNEPAVVAQTRKKQGPAQARKQKIAIALSKARAAGAKIRRRPQGSPTTTDDNLSMGYRHMGKC
jgi:hypothetical protein